MDEEITQRRDLAQTIDRTLALLDAGEPVDERRLFYGVSPEKQAAWESEMVARFGGPAEAAIRDATAAMQSLSPTELLDFKAEIEVIHREFVTLIEAGGTSSSSAAQALTARHHRWVCRSWRPDAEAYASLGLLYASHSDFRFMYEALHPHMAVFLADAMAVYARGALRGTVQ